MVMELSLVATVRQCLRVLTLMAAEGRGMTWRTRDVSRFSLIL